MIDDFQKDPELLRIVGDMDYELKELCTVCIVVAGFNIYVDNGSLESVQIRVYRGDEDLHPCAILTVDDKGERYE